MTKKIVDEEIVEKVAGGGDGTASQNSDKGAIPNYCEKCKKIVEPIDNFGQYLCPNNVLHVLTMFSTEIETPTIPGMPN